MPVNLSIKNAPDDMVGRLRERAARNHRSLQGEMMAILQCAVDAPVKKDAGQIAREIIAEGRAAGLGSVSESVWMIREDRDR